MDKSDFREKLKVTKTRVVGPTQLEIPDVAGTDLPDLAAAVQQIASMKEERMKATVQEVVDKLAGDPEHAAEVLMLYLPQECQEKIRQAQADLGKPLWQMLMGYVMVQADKEEMWAPYILSQWETTAVVLKPKPCGACGELFLNPRFPDAAYCCETCHFGKVETLGHKVDCLRVQKVEQAT